MCRLRSIGCCFAALCLKSVGHTLRIKRLNSQKKNYYPNTSCTRPAPQCGYPACRRGRAAVTAGTTQRLAGSFFKRPAQPLQQWRCGNPAAQPAAASRSGAAKDSNGLRALDPQTGTRHRPKKGWAGLGGFELAGLLGQGLRLQWPLSHTRAGLLCQSQIMHSGPAAAAAAGCNRSWCCRRRCCCCCKVKLRAQQLLQFRRPTRPMLRCLPRTRAQRLSSNTRRAM